jgi:hypothetical protein
MHPAIDSVLKFFACDHLPPHLQLAQSVANRVPNSPETTVAVRAALDLLPNAPKAETVQEAAEKGFRSK